MPVLLTICIATYNRASYLPVTLRSIAGQLDGLDDVEVLVVDGNSTDDTESVVRSLQATCPQLKYLKLPEKGGVDKDFDIAVRESAGHYCWLFTDDDLLKPHAVRTVRAALAQSPDLMVVNAEVRDYDLQRVLDKAALRIERDVAMEFSAAGRDAFFKLCATYITFIGAIVIRRSAWVERAREEFYGSRFIHVGVISTLADATRVVALVDPLIEIRLGNAEWSNIAFRVWTQLWPGLIWSFANLSAQCKQSICAREPWKSPGLLLWYRALGNYSKSQYENHLRQQPRSLHKTLALWIACMPRWVSRLTFFTYATLRRNELQLYCLRDGSKSRNTWFSKE